MVLRHYLNQCDNIVDWHPGNRIREILIGIFLIQENAFENITLETASILSQSPCVNIGAHLLRC